MNRPDDFDPQQTPGQRPDPLRDLLHDAVSDVEPDDALWAIKRRTGRGATRSRRPWLLGAGGAVVATAATVGAIALAGHLPTHDADEPGPAGSPTVQVPEIDEEHALPVYFPGDTPDGPALYREFHPADLGGDNLVTAAVREAVEGDPYDPDYTNPWPEGTTVSAASYDDGVITVDLSGDALGRRPAGMTAEEAQLAVQQVVYTAQGAVKQGRKPVRLLVDGARVDRVLGVDTAQALTNDKVTDTLSLMSITAPREGVEVSGLFTATGVNNGFEAWVGWQLLDSDGDVVKHGFGTAEGAYGNQLYPWQVEVDLSGVEPGSYTFRAYNDDPSGGAEGDGPDEDTRTVIVR